MTQLLPRLGPHANLIWFVLAFVSLFLPIGAFFAAAAGPTIYWHPANTGLSNWDVEALAAAPLSPTVLYAGTWGDGVYRSTDHCAT